MIRNIIDSVRPKIWAWFIIALFLLFVSRCSYAQNIGFESGNLSNWTTSGGDVTASTGISDFATGNGKSWTINPYGSYMAQLYPSGSVTFDNATASLGLTSAENAAIRQFMIANAAGGSPDPTNASWIKRTVTLQAGTTYSFAWNYLSTDYAPFNDGSMISLVHSTNAGIIPTLNNSQQRYGLLGFTNLGSGNYSTDSYGSTGWQIATFTVPETGDYVLGFATFNLGDTVLSPMLFIDEVQGTTLLNGTTFAPVAPNPGSNVPSSSGPTIVSTSTSNQTTSTSTVGSTTTTNNSTTFNNQVYVVIGTATPTTTTTTTTPVTTTTWSDGTTTTSNGTSSSSSTVTWDYTVTGPANAPVSPYLNDNKNGVYITQTNAGSANIVRAYQSGHGNYANITFGDSNNIINVGQGYTFGSLGVPSEAQSASNFNFSGITLTGNTNNVTNTQLGSSNSSITNISGNSNSYTVNQNGNTNQSYGLISGNGNLFSITQTGDTNLASVNLYGTGNNASVNQTGNNHGVVLNLVNAGGANTVNVTQTGTGDAYSLQQTCTNPAGCSVSVIRNK